MKPVAEEGRRRREVVSGGGIAEDVVAVILSHLPLKSLGRFKTVSRSWYQLIQTLNLSPYFLGLFYTILSWTRAAEHDRPPPPSSSSCEGIFRYIVSGKGIDNNSAAIVDPALSFLPISSIRVLDFCNGLLLLSELYCVDCAFYICNPLTKSWTQLYGINKFSLLDFDPKVSANFKIVTFPRPRPTESALMMRALSSETPAAMTWKPYPPIRFRGDDPSDDECYCLILAYLWEGSLYLLFGSDDYVHFGDVGKTMRFDLLDHCVADRQLIELPKGTEKPRDIFLGRLRNKLCLAGLDWINNTSNNNNNSNPHHMVMRMRVWSLSKRNQTVWVLEHDNIITSSHLLCPPAADDSLESTYIGQFHPFLDVVFILSKNTVFAYDLKNLSLNEVCRISSDIWEVTEASIFPFFPSMVDYSTPWKT